MPYAVATTVGEEIAAVRGWGLLGSNGNPEPAAATAIPPPGNVITKLIELSREIVAQLIDMDHVEAGLNRVLSDACGR